MKPSTSDQVTIESTCSSTSPSSRPRFLVRRRPTRIPVATRITKAWIESFPIIGNGIEGAGILNQGIIRNPYNRYFCSCDLKFWYIASHHAETTEERSNVAHQSDHHRLRAPARRRGRALHRRQNRGCRARQRQRAAGSAWSRRWRGSYARQDALLLPGMPQCRGAALWHVLRGPAQGHSKNRKREVSRGSREER